LHKIKIRAKLLAEHTRIIFKQEFLRQVVSYTLQVEHALSKRISINGIASFNYPYLSKQNPTDYLFEFMPQLRWYFQQKNGFNQGLYFSLSVNLVNQQSYTNGSYNPQTDELRLNSTYLPSGYYYKGHISKQKIGVYTGVGFGYKWLLAKRMVIDIGYSIQYAIFQRERFKNIPVQNQWQEVKYNSSDISMYLYFPFQINIGYAF